LKTLQTEAIQISNLILVESFHEEIFKFFTSFENQLLITTLVYAIRESINVVSILTSSG